MPLSSCKIQGNVAPTKYENELNILIDVYKTLYGVLRRGNKSSSRLCRFIQVQKQ